MKSTLRLALATVTLICCRGAALGNGIGVTLFGANSFDSLDGSDGVRDGVFRVSGNLTIGTGASILCNDLGPSGSGACPMSISVGGANALGGDLTGTSPGELNAKGGSGSGNGTLSLSYCHSLAYTGAETPAAVSTQICAGPI